MSSCRDVNFYTQTHFSRCCVNAVGMRHDDELGWHLRRVNAPLCGVETLQTGRTATREEGRCFKSPLRPEGSRCYFMIWLYLSANEHKTNLAAGQTSWWGFSILRCAAWCHPVVFMMFLIIKKLSWPAHSIFGVTLEPPSQRQIPICVHADVNSSDACKYSIIILNQEAGILFIVFKTKSTFLDHFW